MNIKHKIMGLFFLLICFQTFSQNEKGFYMKNNLLMSYYNFGSYSDQGNIYYAEHEFNYRFNQKWSSSVEVGFNLYPGAYAVPLGIKGYYHFLSGKYEGYLTQSYAYNLKIGHLSFGSSRYMGGVGFAYNLKKSKSIGLETGYAFIWDQYGGGNIGLFIGIAFKYKILDKN